MSWPTPQEYNEALQSPGLSFADPDLRRGSLELTPLGLPRPITGNFASVYRLHCGQKDWAVRCFWREYADMQERYAAISGYLAAARLTCTVGFEYLPQGIRLRGAWFPILKMEWIEGQLLDEYVREHLQDRKALLSLARRWMNMAAALEREGVAHGDLQHGNVIVAGDNLKLVDYDCTFVPSLAGRLSHELGHQNYQHPARSARDFGPHVDRFSVWVIYLSLVALAADPELWGAAGGGDECLLLRKADFDSCGFSRLALLAQHADDAVRSLARNVESFVSRAPHEVPPLHVSTADTLGDRRTWTRLGWPGARSRPNGPGNTGPEWLRDHLPHEESSGHGFASSFVPARLSVALSATGLLLSTGVAASSGAPALGEILPLSLLAVIVNCILISLLFWREPAAAQSRRLRREERMALRKMARVEREVRRLETRKASALQHCGEACERLEVRRSQLQEREREKCEIVRESLERFSGLMRERRGLIDAAERAELQAALEGLQRQHVDAFLRSRKLRTAAIPGVGAKLKLRIWLAGVRCAADVNTVRADTIKGLGRKASAVVAWRAQEQHAARRSMPRSVPATIRDPIIARRSRQRARLKAEVERAERAHRLIADVLAAQHGERYEELERRIQQASDECARQCAEIESRLAALRGELPRLHWELEEARRHLGAYAGVTAFNYAASALCPWLLKRR